MTSQTGAVLSAANCDITYYGDYIGYYGNCYDEYVARGRLVGRSAGLRPGARSMRRRPTRRAPRRPSAGPTPTLDESQRDKFGRRPRHQVHEDAQEAASRS